MRPHLLFCQDQFTSAGDAQGICFVIQHDERGSILACQIARFMDGKAGMGRGWV